MSILFTMYTGDTNGTKWWMNATATGEKYQYYPPRGKHTLCLPIPDGYFDENAKKIVKVEQSRAMTNWKRGRAKLKTLSAFRERRTSSLMSSSVELNLVDEAHVDSATVMAEGIQ